MKIPLTGWFVLRCFDANSLRICEFCKVAHIKHVHELCHVTGRRMLVGIECRKKLRAVSPRFHKAMEAELDTRHPSERDPALIAALREQRRQSAEDMRIATEVWLAAQQSTQNEAQQLVDFYLLERSVGGRAAKELFMSYYPDSGTMTPAELQRAKEWRQSRAQALAQTWKCLYKIENRWVQG